LQVANTGVAPFYYAWPVQLGALDHSNALVRTWATPWRLDSILPGGTNALWSFTLANHGLDIGTYNLVLSVRNPLTNGVVFRFANQTQDADMAGWLTLGQVSIGLNAATPRLSGSLGIDGFDLLVSDAVPGVWRVEQTADFTGWTLFTTTNATTTEWKVTDTTSNPAQFYRVVGPLSTDEECRASTLIKSFQ
jgi:hypothetical protein